MCDVQDRKMVENSLAVEQETVDLVKIFTEPAARTEVENRLALCHVISHLHGAILKAHRQPQSVATRD